MATLEEWQAQQVKDNAINVSQADSVGDFNFGSEDSGWLASMAAGVPSGIFKIFEGVATLGATLLDLGVDKDRAESVEAFFEKINPFDEAASATAAGKITELIINLGVPGAPAFRIGSGLAKATLKAKEAGTYLSAGEKTRRIAQGSAATGLTDAIFVGDVEEIGTFGNFLGGPTKLDTDSDTPTSEILNRLKFGLEGSIFAGAISGVGQGISKLRNETGTGKVIEGKYNKIAEIISGNLRSTGFKNKNQFLIGNKKRGRVDADTNLVNEWRDTIDSTTYDLAKKYQETVGNKIPVLTTQKEMLTEMQNVLVSGTGKEGKMLPIFNEVAEIAVDPTTGYRFRNGKGLLKEIKATDPLPNKVTIPEKVKFKVEREPFKVGEKVIVNSKGETGTILNFNRKNIKIGNTNDSYIFKMDGPQYASSKNSMLEKKLLERFNPVSIKTGRTIQEVTIEAVDPVKADAFKKILKNKYKATPKQTEELFNTITAGREKFGELFTGISDRLNPESWVKFQKILTSSLNDVVDRGYDVFRNNAGQLSVAKNFPPTEAVLKETVDYFKKVATQKGYNVGNGVGQINDSVFEKLVDQTWRNATMDTGFITASKTSPGTVKFNKAGLPDMFVDKSIASKLNDQTKQFISTTGANLENITGVDKQVIQKLLGKNKNPMSTLVDGVTNLSAQVRSSQAFDRMVIKNNQLTETWNKWANGFKKADGTQVKPRTGAEPELPFLFNDSGFGQKIAGGVASDFTQIGSAKSADASRKIDRFIDTNLPLRGVDKIEKLRIAEMTDAGKNSLTNPLAGKWALNDVAKSFMRADEGSKSLAAQVYNNLVLYPKGTSQMAKTILAPFTHARNFISATSFAAANGILPFGKTADVKAAWTALQAAGPGMKGSNEFYRMLLEEGVVNSSVRLRQVLDLLQDAKFGEILNNKNSDWALNKLMNRFNKIKKGAEDFYTAEDDFWKIFTFLGEKSRIKNAYGNTGLRLGQEFTDMNGIKRLYNDKTLNQMSAELVRNNVPNYSYVSDFIKNLRKFPLGNFVAFPAEIMRTGVNIVDTALKEINYSVVINGQTVKPLAGRGRQRLMGMAITTAAIPLGTIAAMETIYDITKDETAAMRRYVPDWSKNSVLVPFKKEDGTLQYVDFSHLNAYDTLTRPIQTILNRIEDGEGDQDGIIDDFVLGLIESTKEIFSPFVNESIWTEALQDVAPILGRDGTDSEGRRIWNERDSTGNKLSKALMHLVESQAPLNWRQLQRLGISVIPKDSESSIDKSGKQYDFLNEAAGIAGLRRVDVDPKKSFNYKITDYKKGIRDSRNLFTSATLKGGVTTAKEVVDAYINANRSLYEVNRNLYKDINAAEVLGMSTDSIEDRMDSRGENRAFNALIEGEFRPLSISKDLQEIFAIRAEELNVADPFESAQDVIDGIKEQLENTTLNGDFFPNIPNPFDVSIIESLPSLINNSSLPNVVTGTDLLAGVNTKQVQGVNFDFDKLPTNEKYKTVFPQG